MMVWKRFCLLARPALMVAIIAMAPWALHSRDGVIDASAGAAASVFGWETGVKDDQWRTLDVAAAGPIRPETASFPLLAHDPGAGRD